MDNETVCLRRDQFKTDHKLLRRVAINHINIFVAGKLLREVFNYSPKSRTELLFWALIRDLNRYGPHTLAALEKQYMQHDIASAQQMQKIKNMLYACWYVESKIHRYSNNVTPVITRFLIDTQKILKNDVSLINKGILFILQEEALNELNTLHIGKINNLIVAVKSLKEKKIPKSIFSIPAQKGGGTANIVVALWKNRIVLAKANVGVRINCLNVLKRLDIKNIVVGEEHKAFLPVPRNYRIPDLLEITQPILREIAKVTRK